MNLEKELMRIAKYRAELKLIIKRINFIGYFLFVPLLIVVAGLIFSMPIVSFVGVGFFVISVTLFIILAAKGFGKITELENSYLDASAKNNVENNGLQN
ncbi:hypothetical protein ACFL29_00085 [Patescibacteria group bacterium]